MHRQLTLKWSTMRPRTIRIHVWQVLIALLLCSASNSIAYDDPCPEDCGQVLKACLDEKANRHTCIAIADECLTTCRAKVKDTGLQDPSANQPSDVVVSEDAETFPRSDLLGTWHGQRQGDGSIIKWLIHRDVDGTYAALSLVCKDGIPDWIQKEFGNWDYKNGIYRTITRIIEDSDGRRQPDTPDKTSIETYRVIFLNALAFTYVHTTKDTQYSVTKVDDAYRVDCD